MRRTSEVYPYTSTIYQLQQIISILQQQQQMAYLIVTVLLLHISLGVALRCLQDTGRPCTEHERTHGYLQPDLTGHADFPDSTAIMAATHFAQSSFRRFASTHAAVTMHNGSLHALFVMRSHCSRHCDVCPDNTPYAATPCRLAPNEHYYFGFVGMATVSSSFGIDGEVRALPFDVQMASMGPTIAAVQHVPHHPIHHYFGVRDMRVFTWDDGVYLAILCPRRHSTGLINVMVVQRIFPSHSAATVELHVGAETSAHQWMPIGHITTSTSEYVFARSIEPHQIVQCRHDGRCVEVASTSHQQYFLSRFKIHHDGLRLHGGTNAVRVSDRHYGAILNKEHGNETFAQYAYLFQATHPWTIVSVGRQPLRFLTTTSCARSACTSHMTGMSYVDGKLVISYSEGEANPKYYISSVDEVFADMEDVVDPVVAPSSLQVNRFPDEDPDGPVDDWLQHITIPPIAALQARVALVCVWSGKALPEWMDYFVMSASYAADKGLAC